MSRPTLVFVHGRSQQGRDPVELRDAWLAALRRGLGEARAALIDQVDVRFPFYGDVLDGFARQFDDDVPADILVRGPTTPIDAGFARFETEYVEELGRKFALEPDGADVSERGVQNWGWVLALLRAADVIPGVSAAGLEHVTRDVYLYLSRRMIRDRINGIVADAIPRSGAVVVGHSLGSVVCYDVLRNLGADREVGLYASVGSPLGVGPIVRSLSPLRHPAGVRAWFNALDVHDVVALNPLDRAHFPIAPEVENHLGVVNHTENRHGIDGYLDDPEVGRRIGDALSNLLLGK